MRTCILKRSTNPDWHKFRYLDEQSSVRKIQRIRFAPLLSCSRGVVVLISIDGMTWFHNRSEFYV